MALGLGLGLGARAGGGLSAQQALSLGKSRPIDIVGIGDSLQLFNGYGWDAALAKAYSADGRFGIWATAMYPQQAVGDQYSTQGYQVNGVVGGSGVTTGAPSYFDDRKMPFTEYYYWATGEFTSANTGINLASPSELDVNANLRGHLWDGTFGTGTGAVQIGFRRNDSPFTTLVSDTARSTAGAIGERELTLDLPAATRNFPVQFRLRSAASQTYGPLVYQASRVQNLDKSKGISHHSFFGVGGNSLYDIAGYWQGLTPARRVWAFGKLRKTQMDRGLAPIIVVRICSGFNDRNETGGPTLGPAAIGGANPSQTQAGYADNLRGLISTIEAAYSAQGWPLSELYFQIVTPYPITSGDGDLAPYRAAADAVADASRRYDHFNYARYFNYGDISVSDGVHFTNASADACAAVEVAAIQ